MRILHVISSANPAGGGPIEGIKQLEKIMTAGGNQVEVACGDDPAAPWVKDFPIRLHALGPSKSGYGYCPALIPWLVENASQYDAVVCNGLWQFNSFAVWRAMRKLKRPYVIFTHGMLDPWFKREYPLKHLKKWLYWPWGQYPALRDAAAVLFTCEDEKILARQSFWLYRANERVVNYGTSGPVGEPEAQRIAFLQAFPGLAQTRNFLFLSRIHQKKGCDLLIEAFAKVSANDPSLRLVFAGPDQVGWKPELERLAEKRGVADRVLWTGMLTGDLKWGAYFASEAFVLPSHQENFGIVVAEALACGKPVLISNKVNIWREIEADGAGLVADDTLEGTMSLFTRWLEMPDDAKVAMAAKSRTCFLEHFEITKSAQSLLKILEEVRR